MSVTVNATVEWVVTATDMIESFLDPSDDALTEGDRDYLDEIGNDNGRFDVGDLRKWIRSNGF